MSLVPFSLLMLVLPFEMMPDSAPDVELQRTQFLINSFLKAEDTGWILVHVDRVTSTAFRLGNRRWPEARQLPFALL